MLRRIRGIRAAQRAMGAKDRGDLELAEQELTRSIEFFGSEKNSYARDQNLGASLLELGLLRLAIGNRDGLKDLARAETHICDKAQRSTAGGRERATTFYLDLANSLGNIGDFELADEYRLKAKALSETDPHLDNYAHEIEESAQLDEQRSTGGRATAAEVQRLRNKVDCAKNSQQRLRQEGNLISALLSSSLPNEVDEGASRMLDWWPLAFRSLNIDDSTGHAVILADYFDRDLGNHTGSIFQVLREMQDAARNQRAPLIELRVETALASLSLSVGNFEDALTYSLDALVVGAVELSRLESGGMRTTWLRFLDLTRRSALLAASRLQQPQLVAELLEVTRIQAELLHVDKGDSDRDDPSLVGAVIETGRSQFGELVWVSVEGNSNLATLAATKGIHYRTIALDDVFTSPSDDPRGWFGSWVGFGLLVSAYRNPSGQWDSIFSIGQSALESVVGDQPRVLETNTASGTIDVAAMTRKSLFSSYQSEQAAMLKASEEILPSLLRKDLTQSYQNKNILPLGISADRIMTELPIQALALSSGNEVIRLIEAATVTVLPPLKLWYEIRTKIHRRSDPKPVEEIIACLDPSGDLPQARRNIPSGTTYLLTAPSNKLAHPSLDATTENFQLCLNQIDGETGLLVYSGHTSHSNVADPLSAGFQLAEAQLLTARHLHSEEIRFPQRVLLSSCGSSGAIALVGGEWTGIVGAMLRNGATSIIATNWSIVDGERTTALENAVINEIKKGTPMPGALRDGQLTELTSWRQLALEEGDHRAALHFDKISFPMNWGAFILIGL